MKDKQENKIEYNRISLTEQQINDWLYQINQPDDVNLEMVLRNPDFLDRVLRQTDRVCRAAVSMNGLALQHVVNKTKSLCILAVRNTALALEYVDKQTEEICLEALKAPDAEVSISVIIDLIENLTPKLKLEIIKLAPFALQYIEEQSEELCLEAVKRDGNVLVWVKNPTRAVCIEAVKENSNCLSDVPKIYFEECERVLFLKNKAKGKSLDKRQFNTLIVQGLEKGSTVKDLHYLIRKKYKGLDISYDELRVYVKLMNKGII